MKRSIEGVGIHGIGTFLPDNIRRNDWWPEEIVAKWRARAAANLVRPGRAESDPTGEGVERVLATASLYRDDPFKGAVERRIRPEGMPSSTMEIAAARQAIERAGIRPDQIGLLLTYSQLPDHLVIPNTTLLHRELGLPEKCFSLGTEAACNSFLLQLSIAEQMIRGGRAEYALLIQSSAVSRLIPQDDQQSVWFGDGATAEVLGPVPAGKGLLGQSHRTDGSLYEALLADCGAGRWFDGGMVQLHVKDRAKARRMLLLICDLAKQSIDEALEDAGHRPADVNFYATHQSTEWFRKVTQEHARLDNARFVDSFKWTAGLGASNIPFMLALGQQEGLLREGDLVAMHTGGSGITWSGAVMRWGTG
jgi:3-oxoacyl-[acyl-carrier-protein] synthase-3